MQLLTYDLTLIVCYDYSLATILLNIKYRNIQYLHKTVL